METILSVYSPIAKALGWSIVHSLWQVIWIALLVRIIFVFTSNRSANFRYVVSMFALSSCFGWFILTFSELYQYQQVLMYVGEADFLDLTNKATIIGESRSIEVDWLQQLEHQLTNYSPFLAIIWFIGILALAIRTFRSYYQLQQLVKTNTQPIPEKWLVRLSQLTQQIGISKKVKWLTTTQSINPITFYHFKPLILTPLTLLTGLTPTQVEAILLHELAHIKRHDYLFNWLQSMIEVVLFYHPAIWWLSSQIRIEREHCCDDLVLKYHQQPMLYANALTQISVLQFSSQNILNNHLAMSLNQNKGRLTKRVFRLFGQYEKHNLRSKSAVLAIVLLIGTFSMAFHFPLTVDTNPKEELSKSSILNVENEILEKPSIITIDNVKKEIDEVEIEAAKEPDNQKIIDNLLTTPPDTMDLNRVLYVVDGKILGNADEVDYDLGKGVNHIKMIKSKEAVGKYGEVGKYGAFEIVSKKKISTDYDFYISYNAETGEQIIKFEIADTRKVRITVKSQTTKGYNSILLDADFQGKFEHKWDATKYPKGVYNITLELEGQQFSKSIVEKE